jgi:hypothetical protein
VSELNLAQNSPARKKVPDFKFQSNKVQFEFNSDRESEISKAVKLLEKNRTEAAIDTLRLSVTQLNKRNKIVRIADKYGWDVVQEYQDDPLTDDADDASKLRQAIFRAKKRSNNKKPYDRTARAFPAQESQPFPGQLFRPHGPDFGQSFAGTGYGNYPYEQAFIQPHQGIKKQSPATYASGSAAKNTCFYCNKFGHWANKCPERGNNPTTSTKPTDNKQ